MMQAARFRQAVVASAFGNATTLPLVLGSSLCLTIPELAPDSEASSRYIGYLALYQLAWSIALWTLGYGYLIGGGSKGTKAPNKYRIGNQDFRCAFLHCF